MQDRDRLSRERHDVRRPIRLAGLGSLHSSGRDRPGRGIEVELSPLGMANLARPLEDQRNKTQRRTRHRQSLVVPDRT